MNSTLELSQKIEVMQEEEKGELKQIWIEVAATTAVLGVVFMVSLSATAAYWNLN